MAFNQGFVPTYVGTHSWQPSSALPGRVAVAVDRRAFLATLVARPADEVAGLNLHRRLQHGLGRQPAVAAEIQPRLTHRRQELLPKTLRRGYFPPPGDDSFPPAVVG